MYSTVVVHDKDNATSREPDPDPDSLDLYATMVYKDDVVEEEESLPPLLMRLPKDFGLGGDDISDSDNDDVDASVSGTLIVKTDRRRSSYSGRNVSVSSQYMKPWSAVSAPFHESRSPKIGNEDDAGDFSTFVMRVKNDEEEEDNEDEDGMGTMVRRGAGSGGGETMRMAVESMQKVGEVGTTGHKNRRKSSGGGEGGGAGGIALTRQPGSEKMSSSSIPECVTREDPSTKYELLHELGKILDLCFKG